MKRTVAVSTLLATLYAGLNLTGCSTSVATEEPGLGRVQSLLDKGDQQGAAQYVDHLDTRSRNSLVPKMLKDGNPSVVYLGGALLVRQKLYDEAAPVMAELIVNARNGNALQARMANDWSQDADPTVWPTMVSKVSRILMVNMENYLPDSRTRAEQFLVTMLKLEVNKPFNKVDAATAVMKLTRQMSTDNS